MGSHRGILVALWSVVVSVCAGCAALAFYVVEIDQKALLEVTRATLQRSSVSMAAHAERVFNDAAHRLHESNQFLSFISPRQVIMSLQATDAEELGANALHSSNVLMLLDEWGVVIAPEVHEGLDLSRSTVVQTVLRTGSLAPLFGTPEESDNSGRFVLPMAMRAMPNRYGVEVIYVVTPLDGFLELYTKLVPGRRGAAGLFHGDGMLIARQPFERQQLGQLFRGPLFLAMQHSDSGVIEGPVQTDGMNRIIAFNRAGSWPFFAAAAADRDEVLSTIATRRIWVFIVASVTASLVIIAGFALSAQLYRERRHILAMEASGAALRRVAMVAENTQASVIVTDAQGKTEWVNPAFVAASGFQLENMVGRKPGEVLQGPETDTTAATAVGDAVRAGQPFDIEIVNYTKDGRPFWIRLVGDPVRDEAGTIHHFIAVQTDVTARRAAEARAADMSRLSALGQLAGGIAHDFNNLLMVVSLNLELLAERSPPDDGGSLIRSALHATMRGHDLTKQLLSFAQRAPALRHPVAIAPLLGPLLVLLEKTMPRGIRLVPELTCDWLSSVDPGLLESAVTNLVVNARDAMGDVGEITVSCRQHHLSAAEALCLSVASGPYVRICVTDTGPGIPPELVARVFEPFYTTKANGKGTGLGLSMVYGIARQARGAVTINSTVGSGTTVSILLPVADAPQPVDAPQALPELSVRGLTVLIVDDEPQILVLLERSLRDAGIRVRLALDRVQARATLSENRPDLLIADVRLANGESGVDLACEARDRWPSLPVVFITGDPGPTFAERLHAVPGAMVLQKPFGRAALIDAIMTVLGPDPVASPVRVNE